MDANERTSQISRPAREIVNLVDDDDDDVDDNAGVWPGFADLDEMELWKGIVLSMGEDPSYEICKKYKQKDQDDESIIQDTPNQLAERQASIALSDTASEEDETASEEDEPVAPQKVVITPAVPTSTGLTGLNRAQMEKERLERAKRQGIQSTSEPPAKRMKTENVNERSSGISKGLQMRDTNGSTLNASATHSNSSLQYPDGTIKWTYVIGYPREEHHITIEEVLQKNTLKAAVLSGFQIDPPWILKKLDLANTALVIVAHSDSPETSERPEKDSKVQVVYPKLKSFGAFGVGCMHSKLQLLFHTDYLRVVVPTGNLVAYDWGETGIMENMMYIQDFPQLPTPQSQESMPQFAKDLLYFIKTQTLPSHILNNVCEYDFQRSAGIEFVHSMSGEHMDHLDRQSKNGLASAISRLGLKPQQGQTLQLCYVTSSLGNLNDDFLTEMYRAAKGIQQEPAKRGTPHTVEISSKDKSKLKIFFPSEKTVQQSRGGAGSGGTICLQSNHWNNPAFPKPLVFDCVNKRPGLLMHNKVLCGRLVRPMRKENTLGIGKTQNPLLVKAQQKINENDEVEIAKSWFYIGSANLSPSAWGNKVVTDRATKKPKIVIRNWECGIVCSAEKLGFGSDSWNVLKRFMFVDGAAPVVQVGKPWILAESGE